METYTKLSQADSLLENIMGNFSHKNFGQHFLLSTISNEMMHAAEMFFSEKQNEKGVRLLKTLSNWIKDDLVYFISFKGNDKKMYEWDIVCGLQMLDNVVQLLEKHHQRELANQLLKDYYRLNIEYSSNDPYTMKLTA